MEAATAKTKKKKNQKKKTPYLPAQVDQAKRNKTPAKHGAWRISYTCGALGLRGLASTDCSVIEFDTWRPPEEKGWPGGWSGVRMSAMDEVVMVLVLECLRKEESPKANFHRVAGQC